jgi:hypothetical protein
MKFFYAISILVQLLLAVLSWNRNKMSYMLYLWKSLFDHDVFSEHNNANSDSTSYPEKSKSETISDRYSFLLER